MNMMNINGIAIGISDILDEEIYELGKVDVQQSECLMPDLFLKMPVVYIF